MEKESNKLKQYLNYIHLFLAIFIIGWLNSGLSIIYNRIPGLIKYSVFVLWFGLSILNRKYMNKIILKSIPIFIMIIWISLMSQNIIADSYRQNFIYLFMIFSIFLYYSDDKYIKQRKIILVFLVINILYVGINTYIELLKNPLLSRYLSTGIGQQEQILHNQIYNNVGTYGFFYSLVMVIIVFLYRILEIRKKTILNIIIIIFFLLLLIQGNFTTSLLLLLLSTFLIIVLYKNKGEDNKKLFLKILVGILIIIIVSINLVDILNITLNIPILSNEIKDRIIEIRNRFMYGQSDNDSDLQSRIMLYNKSFGIFCDNMLMGSSGNDIVGGHSMILDLLGLYGIFAFFVFYYFYIIYKEMKKFNDSNYIIDIVFIYFIVLSLINTSAFAIIFVTLLIFVPFFLKDISENKGSK